ncbi:MAG: isoprenyl transferase [Firmicutes bacterium]|nr:isoprenyl transferase [Bacillota bacterium]
MKIINWFKKKKQSALTIPEHLAIIMDGNGRWAEKRGLPRSAGHRAGLERLRDLLETCLEYGVKYLTVYAFSTENWRRPPEEVDYLMGLFLEALQNEVPKLHQRQIRVRFIGLKENLKPELVTLMEEAEKLTAANRLLTLNIAINYGGRAEILAAIKGVLRQVKDGKLDPEQFQEEDFTKRLFTTGQPDPDLLIRPGGEWRISNFLIWQAAYTELYFSKHYWPDFSKEHLLAAFESFSRRERRYGQVKGGGKGR